MKTFIAVLRIILCYTFCIQSCSPTPNDKIGRESTTVIAEFASKKEIPDTLGDASLRREIQNMYSLDTIPSVTWKYGTALCNSDGEQEKYKLEKIQDGNEEYYRIEEK